MSSITYLSPFLSMLRVCFGSLILWRISGSRAQGDSAAVTFQHVAGCFLLPPVWFTEKGRGISMTESDIMTPHHHIHTTQGGWRWCSGNAVEFILEFTSQNEERNDIYRRFLPALVLIIRRTGSGHAFALSLALDVAQRFISR